VGVGGAASGAVSAPERSHIPALHVLIDAVTGA